MDMQLDVLKDLRDNNIYLLRSASSKDTLTIGIARSNIAYAIIIHSVITARTRGESWQLTAGTLAEMLKLDKIPLRKYLRYLVNQGILDAVDEETFTPKMDSSLEHPIFIPVYNRPPNAEDKDNWTIRTRILRSPRDNAAAPKLPDNAIETSPEIFNGGHTLIAYNYRGLIGEDEPVNILVAHNSLNKFDGYLKATWFAANGVKQVPSGFAILKHPRDFWELATPAAFKTNEYCLPEFAPVPFWQQMSVESFFGTAATESSRNVQYKKIVVKTQEILKDHPEYLPWITSVGAGNYNMLVRSSDVKISKLRKQAVLKSATQHKTTESSTSEVKQIKLPLKSDASIQDTGVEERKDLVASKESTPLLSIRGRLNTSQLTSAQLIRRLLGSSLDVEIQDILIEQIIQARMWKYSTRIK